MTGATKKKVVNMTVTTEFQKSKCFEAEFCLEKTEVANECRANE